MFSTPQHLIVVELPDDRCARPSKMPQTVCVQQDCKYFLGKPCQYHLQLCWQYESIAGCHMRLQSPYSRLALLLLLLRDYCHMHQVNNLLQQHGLHEVLLHEATSHDAAQDLTLEYPKSQIFSRGQLPPSQVRSKSRFSSFRSLLATPCSHTELLGWKCSDSAQSSGHVQ